MTLPPGARTSLPHAESLEEEFVYVISGTPHVWIDGFIYELAAGCAVGFPAGTGISHCLILIEPYLKTVYSAKRIRLGISDENDVCAFWRKMDFSENGWTYQWKGEQKTARVVEFDKQL